MICLYCNTEILDKEFSYIKVGDSRPKSCYHKDCFWLKYDIKDKEKDEK
ncbi:MAG: hypothetical protein K0S93_99 [Nitrososphaeraceae archaeon]|jgi:hypothetical protein|nr:hypothetical protein [Nitrososphaeraceae archaeon]MDF2790745.1 hypothetical protein [Neobacillus sp.]